MLAPQSQGLAILSKLANVIASKAYIKRHAPPHLESILEAIEVALPCHHLSSDCESFRVLELGKGLALIVSV